MHGLAMSFASEEDGRRAAFVQRAVRVLQVVAQSPATVVRQAGGAVVLAGTSAHTSDLPGTFAAPLTATLVSVDGQVVEPHKLPRLADHGRVAFDRIAPPGAMLCWSEQTAEVVAYTDSVGLKQLFYAEGTGMALCATSSVAIGAVLGLELDDEAIAAFALLGYYAGTRTAFRGVKKLPPAGACTLRSGRAAIHTYAQPVFEVARSRSGDAPSGVDAVRTALGACIRAFPDATLELSGGMDSRMIVATLTQQERLHRSAFTLASNDTDNVAIARQIVALAGFDHQVVEPGHVAELAGSKLAALCHDASLARDHATNAIDSATLDWVERGLHQGGRITGQNGEFARGVYYRGIPTSLVDRRAASGVAARGLARYVTDWRLLVNRSLDDRLFPPGLLDAGRDLVRHEVAATLELHAPEYTRGLDELYLTLRMSRWVGPEYSASATRRPVLAPFFHPSYLEWARSMPASAKRNGRVFALVLTRLDPVLAALPLDRRTYTIADLANGNLNARLGNAARLARRLQAKVAQRARGAEMAYSTTRTVAGSIVEHWRTDPRALDPLLGVGFLRPEGISDLTVGTATESSATIGFLISLAGTLDIVSAARSVAIP